MAYIKRKRIKEQDYYYLAESYRSDGKVRTRTVKYLGRTLEVPEDLRPLLGRQRRRAWQGTLWGQPVPATAKAAQVVQS